MSSFAAERLALFFNRLDDRYDELGNMFAERYRGFLRTLLVLT